MISGYTIDWDTLFMQMVYCIASKSKDRNTHVGAVIVGPNHEIRSVGYNGFPRNINDDIAKRQERPYKYNFFAHAEVNAIYNAARVGIPIDGCILYTNSIPCCSCCVGIINSGIKEVVVDKKWQSHNEWKEKANITKMMFNEAGIIFREWDGELFPIQKYQNGQIICNGE